MNQHMLVGMKVQIAPETPKYKLPEDLPLPPGFREEFNAWALARFGTTCIVPKDQLYIINKNTVVMQQMMYDRLKKVARPGPNFADISVIF